MPDYKRKKRSYFTAKPKADRSKFAAKGKKKNKIEIDEVVQPPKRKHNLNVLKGNKLEIRRRWQRIAAIVLVIILAAVICELSIPAGIVESVTTLVYSFGSGNYPIDFDSTNTENVVSKGNFYYVLTDNEVMAITKGGKVAFAHNHGFENPVIKTSKTRALVFDQGGTSAIIFKLGGVSSTLSFEKEIINGVIGEDGTYVIVTGADGYVAAVNVYTKRDKLVYQWYSSNDMINNVAVAPNGKKIAISLLSSNVSGFNSKVMILNFKSANAEFTKNYDGEIVYNLSGVSSRGVGVATANTYDFIRWRKYESKQYENEYNLQMLRESNKGTLLLYNRENDKTDNRIVIISKKGVVKHEIKFNGIITDIAYENNHIYCISDTKAYILDMDGKIVRSADCGFGVVRFSVISQKEIVVITDNQISKIKFE